MSDPRRWTGTATTRYVLPVLGDFRLDRIHAVRLRRFVADLHARGLSRNTVRLAFAPVKLVLAQAFEDGLLDRNPAAGIRIQAARVERKRENVLTRDPVEALVAAVAVPDDRLLVRFMVETGLRIFEVVALRWCDVEGGRVNVHRRFRKGRMGEPKSRAGFRTTPLSPAMARDLWQQRKAATWNGDGDLVWPTATGSPRDHGNLYTRVVKPAAEAVGLAWVGWHTLRHTCATLLIAEHGLNPKQLQTWLGHESAEFSLSLYTHLTGDDLPTVEWTRSCVHDVSTAPSKPTIRSLVNR